MITLKISLLKAGIFLEESLFFVALDNTDETAPPKDPLVVVLAITDVTVLLAAAEMLSVAPAAPVGIGCPSCSLRY